MWLLRDVFLRLASSSLLKALTWNLNKRNYVWKLSQIPAVVLISAKSEKTIFIMFLFKHQMQPNVWNNVHLTFVLVYFRWQRFTMKHTFSMIWTLDSFMFFKLMLCCSVFFSYFYAWPGARNSWNRHWLQETFVLCIKWLSLRRYHSIGFINISFIDFHEILKYWFHQFCQD